MTAAKRARVARAIQEASGCTWREACERAVIACPDEQEDLEALLQASLALARGARFARTKGRAS